MHLNQTAAGFLQKYSVNLAKSFGVEDASHKFAISDPMETKLRAALLESVEFLRMITTMQVDQIKGQVVKVGNYGIATGRKAGGRFTSEQGVDGHTYELVETDSCSATTWALLSTWANAGNLNEFMKLINQNATLRFALDMLRVGFNGVSAEATTDPVANPNGEDVNKGWHQIVKEKAPDQIMTDPIYFNPDASAELKDGEYKTLDAIVTELKNTFIHPSLRNDPRLVVLVGADLTATAQTKLMNQADKPSEKVAAQQMDKNIGGMRAYTPPFFPGKRIAVTILSNLHIYTQKGTAHRKAKDEEDRKQFENSYWRNEGYAIEEFEVYAAVDEAAMNIGPAPAA
ncbi:phage major capsid protein, P2 family [Pseudoalteromonas sp. 2CM39R]|uniref:phage major capsid protein, P2 family n=1 Tax=Pseudoalteromonas sp. 2CM39R TaxID=2929856 RepID=UPI0020BF55B3|nr:phage major capsid protein, P2 family [Pseudoalteromonas sp. 2CM39R]MCK8127249.1 phage major capsid protein, P2 family [Pseudoalteromonas sp. 2CM39R]